MMLHRALRTTAGPLAVLGVVLLLAGASAGEPERLDGRERLGYLQWLHSLERTVAAREAGGVQEERLLYPFDLPSWEGDDPRPYRHLAIGKAVLELEEIWADREHHPSPLAALSNARNYVHLSEYDSALVWYEITERADKEGRFSEDVARESLAAALAAGDSLGAARGLTNTLGATEIARRADEVVVAYRWLLTNRDARSLDHLIQKVAAEDSLLTPRLRLWHARALAWREQPAECLAQLRLLVAGGALSQGLEESERTWVVTKVPDLYLVLDDVDAAADLYGALASSSLEELSLWGAYQLAGTALMTADYSGAAAGYRRVCEGERHGPWQDHACANAALAENLERLRKEGEPYGAAAFYQR
ncbi:MAG: hypothetical protein GY838_06955 [bacterium]|nr:hypothetical protein [bacterium]